MNDPIADNQTENTITILLTGSATNEVRDRATAALLSGLQKLGNTVSEMKSNLWKPSDIMSFFDEQHQRKCAECPAKKKAESPVPADGGWREVAMLLLKYGGWIIIIVGAICGVKVNL